MKKKIFTLLTLLLCVCSGAWAQTTIFSYATSSQDNVAGTYTATGGTFEVGVSSKYEADKGVKLDGDNGTKWILITLSSGETLKEDDVITIQELSSSTPSGSDYGISIGTTVFTAITTLYLPSGKKNELTNVTYTVVSGDGLAGQSAFYAFRASGKSTYINAVTISRPSSKSATSEALKSTGAVKVDDTALTLDATTNGYSISGTTITLSDDISAYSAPTNVKLVKTITYDDSSTEDDDVTVTFDGTVMSGYYIGTASVGLSGSVTNYTVRVKRNAAPVLTADASSISIASYRLLGSSKKITLTGSNLTGDASVTWASSVSGLTVTPTTFTVTDGAVDQEFTIAYQSNDAVDEATVNLTFAVGEKSVVVPVTYSSTAAVSLSSISAAKTWDFSKLTSTNVSEGRYGDSGIKLSDETSPSLSDEVTYENYNGKDLSIAAGFDGTTIAFTGQYPSRNNTMCQNGTLHFKTTVPGVITVEFSDTGSTPSSSAKRRYLNINGTNTSFYTSRPTSGTDKSNDKKTSDPIAVLEGDVYITGMEEDGSTAIAICVYTLTFTPASETATITPAKYATFVTKNKVTVPDGVEAYIVTNATTSEVTLGATSLSVIPAETPVIIYKDVDANTDITFTATDADASNTDGNKLLAATTSKTQSDATTGNVIYVLNKVSDKVGFYKLSATGTLAVGKAYIELPETGAPEYIPFFMDGSETTGVNDVRSKMAEVNGDIFDLQGRKVANPTKGLYIVNGRVVVIK